MMNGSDGNSTVDNNCDLLRQRFVSLYPVEMWKSEGFFDDEDLFNINCHWLKFDPIKPTTHLAMAILYIVIFAIGGLSNALVIYIIIR